MGRKTVHLSSCRKWYISTIVKTHLFSGGPLHSRFRGCKTESKKSMFTYKVCIWGYVSPLATFLLQTCTETNTGTYLRIYFNKQHFFHASWRVSVLFIITRTACLEVERDAGGVASHQRYSASRRRLRAWRRASLGHVTRPADAHATMITWSIEGQPPSYHRRKPCGLKEKSSNFSQESYQI